MEKLLEKLGELELQAAIGNLSAGELAQSLISVANELQQITGNNPKIEFLAKKMYWLQEIVKSGNDTRSEIVKEAQEKITEKEFGVVRAATGVGKSAMIYLDIIRHLMDKSDKKRKVFVISTPLLVLNEQFFGDLMETVYGLGLVNKDNCIVLNNSCDEQMKKSTVKLTDVNGQIHDTQITKAGIDGLSESKEVTFIVTTHKSFDKLLIPFKSLNPEDWMVEIYIDESHTADIA